MSRKSIRNGLGAPSLTSVAHRLCTATSAAGHGAEVAVITTLEYLAGMRPGESPDGGEPTSPPPAPSRTRS